MDDAARFGRGELAQLGGWCRAHGMYWMPGASVGGAPALLLQPHRAAADPLLIALAADELRLLDPAGDVLATASSLPALLDALDAGVAEAPALARA